MTLSIWRYAHLALAILSSLFLFILAITGAILALDAVVEKSAAHRAPNFDALTLADVIPVMRQQYTEIVELSVDHNGSVQIDAFDAAGNAVKAYVDPNTGQRLGDVTLKHDFMLGVTALHRSLFLHETGRILVGIASFLLFLITTSGFALIVKRQQGIRHFFTKINRDFLAQYLHVVVGRWSLLPILLISLTGTYLFLARMDVFKKPSLTVTYETSNADQAQKAIADFDIFKTTKLAQTEKIEFPFVEDDPEEFFLLSTKKGNFTINQITGDVVAQAKYSSGVLLEKLSLELHTGRSHMLLAIVLGIASLNIVLFIYSGFAITYRRTRNSIKNRYKAEEASIILFVGSENGSTLFFANQVHGQLLQAGKRSMIVEMNAYGRYPKATHFIFFTSTFGLGDAPTNANKFLTRLSSFEQQQEVSFSVVGFGSRSYSNYCGYAIDVDSMLEQQSWAKRFLPLATVNDRSAEEFVGWATQWSEKAAIALHTTPAVYQSQVTGLRKMKVVEKTAVTADNQTFKIVLKPIAKAHFSSGDLLGIFPTATQDERFYSIGAYKGMVHLLVKLHAQGLGSNFLYGLALGEVIPARILSNAHFHFPQHAPRVLMIANGTGIAPFLGMIMSNKRAVESHLYVGFRQHNAMAAYYEGFADTAIGQGKLTSYAVAFSREKESQYVMDLINRDAPFVMDLLESGGVIMICGSLAMQQDVEMLLETLLLIHRQPALANYKQRGQLLADCY
ncbi:PepSY domain-containing protein [Sphingobacterium paludis]|uniref:NADPH--hemoprotein reductase n=1 Tax=Sphingobacterium paludis TaxID=1476465 RepID=A0A4R7DEQ5_9SPHI|nr:PepSY domain-containing protein [Sphingobacterium paludis]TDS17666.1 sulfite reductase (NADPH) flavoprotein alpha-component [Sphingobacterium paludis]